MYDSMLTLLQDGTIIGVDAGLKDHSFDDEITDYVGKSFTLLFGSSQTALLNAFLEKIFDSGKLQCIDFLYDNRLYQLKGVTSQPGQAICIITNNAMHRKVLMEIEEHNLNTIVNSYVDSVWSFDTNYTLVTANKAFLDTRKRLNQQELHIGDNIFKHTSEINTSKWLPIYERVLQGETICFEEKRMLDERGIDVELYLTPIYSPQQQIIGCLGVTRDITARKRAEEDIASYTARLETFAFTASHELRRPLANIIGIADLLEDETINEADKTRAIQMISQSIRELDEITTGMIELIGAKEN